MSGPQASDVSVLIAAADTDARPGPDPAVLPLEGRPVVDWVADKARQLGAQVLVACAPGMQASRSEERRVGKECRSRWSPYH